MHHRDHPLVLLEMGGEKSKDFVIRIEFSRALPGSHVALKITLSCLQCRKGEISAFFNEECMLEK